MDDAIQGGQAWWLRILDQIRLTEIFIYAATPASLASDACNSELSYATALRKVIVPVICDNKVKRDEFPGRLAQLQWVDYVSSDKAALKRLAKSLGTWTSYTPLPDPLPEPPAPPVSGFNHFRERLFSNDQLSESELQTIREAVFEYFARAPRDIGVRASMYALRVRFELGEKYGHEIDGLLGIPRDDRQKEQDAVGSKKRTTYGSAILLSPPLKKSSRGYYCVCVECSNQIPYFHETCDRCGTKQ